MLRQEAICEAGFVEKDLLQAPTVDEFKKVLQRRLDSPKEGYGALGREHRSKQEKLRTCLAEAMVTLDRNFLQNAQCIALHQDGKAHELVVRFRAVDGQLNQRTGLLGMKSLGEHSGGAHLARVTQDIVSEFCTGDAQFEKHFKSVVELLNADAAGDENVCLRILKREAFQNVKAYTKDRTHAARRILSRPWSADETLATSLDKMVTGPSSMVTLIQNSNHLSQLFNGFVKKMGSDEVKSSRIKNLAYRKHRFDSLQRPLGRFVLFLDAVISVTVWVTAHNRDASETQVAQDFLDALSNQELVLVSMAADAADETLTFIRFLDTEDHDVTAVQSYAARLLDKIHWLFNNCKVVTCGYCEYMLKQLEKRRGFLVRDTPKTIGGLTQSNKDQVLLECQRRMQVWVKMACQAVQSEFPAFDVLSAFSLFDITADSAEDDSTHARYAARLAKDPSLHWLFFYFDAGHT